MTKMTEEMVRSYFPQLSEIKNQEYAKKAAEIWVEAFENSCADEIVLVTGAGEEEYVRREILATRAPGVALVKHTESVTANALMIARNTVEKYGYEIDTDILILAAVLHDVCKLEEMEMGDQGSGTSRKSSLGKIYQHGFLSGYYTQKYGLPNEVTGLVVAHSGQSKVIPRSIEGMILYYADMMDADIHFVQAGTTLCLETH